MTVRVVSTDTALVLTKPMTVTVVSTDTEVILMKT